MADRDELFSTGYADFPSPDHHVVPTRYTRPPRAGARRTKARTQRAQRAGTADSQASELEVTLSDIELHAKIRDSDDSSVDENYDVASLAESIDEQLTYVR